MDRRFRPLAVVALVGILLVPVTPAAAETAGWRQDSSPQPERSVPPESPDRAIRGNQQQGQDQQEEQEERQRYEEVIVVTASRIEQLLLDAPTAISVIGAAEIETSPATNYADLLRSVPGLNVSQTSARDINLTSRSATSTLATSQLVLVDGRTVYQDFFGFVLWDLLPVNLQEIEQIEVVRGPGSAVWGANAMTGVVNVITRSPRDLGDRLRIRAGGGERNTGYGSLLYSAVRGDQLSYKLSGSIYTQEAWPRPETLPSGQPGGLFPNKGTNQPKFDGRVDWEMGPRSRFSFSGGIAGTSGIIHTGIGPFDIDSGSRFGYVSGDYERDNLNVRVYGNFLSADSTNLLNGLPFDFATQTYDISGQNTTILDAGRHILTYGGNVRLQNFDLSIAPAGDDRQEGGAFIEDTFTVNDYLVVHAGGRLDGFSVLDSAVFSPRVSASVRPWPDRPQVIRLSFGRAFRAPSMVNNFLDTVIFNRIDLGAITGVPGLGNFIFPTFARGNEDLVEEQLDQVEIGYRGVFLDGDVGVDAAYYFSNTEDNIDFFPARFYSPADPPPGWPLPNVLLALIPLPKTFSYRNIGEVDNQGIELGVQGRVLPTTRVNLNYTWQDEPDPTGIAVEELNIPPTHTLNFGLNGTWERFLYQGSVNYVDEAFWADVLDARFHGTTEAFTTLNLSFGYEFPQGLRAMLKATNVTDEPFQQHVFGDVIGRRVLAEVTYTLDLQ